MNPTRSVLPALSSGIVLWGITGLGLAFGISGWMRSEPPRELAETAVSAESDELRRLRVALAASTSENEALRLELDRFVARLRKETPELPASGNDTAQGHDDAGGASWAERGEKAQRLADALSRAAAGDESARKDVARAMAEIRASGPETYGMLRDAYLSTENPRGRMMMLSTLVYTGGVSARDFLMDQLFSETDPELRRMLVRQAAGFATPDVASALSDTLVETLRSESDPTTRLAAVRGLRYARGTEVDQALLAAARDPREDIRLAALSLMVSRPDARDSLVDLLEREASPRVREIGRCRLLIAESGG